MVWWYAQRFIGADVRATAQLRAGNGSAAGRKAFVRIQEILFVGEAENHQRHDRQIKKPED